MPLGDTQFQNFQIKGEAENKNFAQDSLAEWAEMDESRKRIRK